MKQLLILILCLSILAIGSAAFAQAVPKEERLKCESECNSQLNHRLTLFDKEEFDEEVIWWIDGTDDPLFTKEDCEKAYREEHELCVSECAIPLELRDIPLPAGIGFF